MTNKPHIWSAEVRDYELDFQGIVNNSVYLNYLEHARHQFISARGMDIVAWHQQGYDLVLVHTELSYKFPLRSQDGFYVTTNISKTSRLRFGFAQLIYRKPDDKLILVANSVTTCIDANGKPALPEELEKQLGI